MNNAEKTEYRCGQCAHFDRFDVTNDPFEQVTVTFELDDKSTKQVIVNKGVCRTNCGLIYGKLNELTICKHSPPEKQFLPRGDITLDSIELVEAAAG